MQYAVRMHRHRPLWFVREKTKPNYVWSISIDKFDRQALKCPFVHEIFVVSSFVYEFNQNTKYSTFEINHTLTPTLTEIIWNNRYAHMNKCTQHIMPLSPFMNATNTMLFEFEMHFTTQFLHHIIQSQSRNHCHWSLNIYLLQFTKILWNAIQCY